MRFGLALFVILLLLGVSSLNAATYYVAKGGNNSNSGTATNAAKLTIQAALNLAISAGDTVYVLPEGQPYEESLSTSTDGSNGNHIDVVGNWNYISDEWSATPAIIRKITFTGANYQTWVGFEMTHANTSYGIRPIQTSGTCTYIQIVDWNIHDVYVGDTEQCIFLNGSPSYVTLRGNRIYYLNPPSLGGSHANYAIGGALITPNHIVTEYNTITRANDYYGLFGNFHIVRNNVFMDHDDSYWTTSTGHSDFVQVGSDGLDVGTKNHIYERNFGGDNQCMGMAENVKNGHFFLFQDQQPGGIGPYGDNTNMVVRGNIGFRINDGVLGVIGTDGVRAYNNSFYDLNPTAAGYTQIIFWRFACIDSMVQNTLFNGIAPGNLPIEVLNGSTATTSHNGGIAGSGHSSFLFTTDPLYTSPASPTRNFYLQSGSPARGVGTAQVTITSTSGSGTSFTVDRPWVLTDGFGITEGDTVIIGGTTTRVSSVNWATSTITVAASVTWTQNVTKVYWGNTTLDLGALPYGSTKLTAATISNAGTTYTVTPTGDARGVWFYQNGIPHTWDYDAPYSATITGTVTAKAYALYAQDAPVVTATTAVSSAYIRIIGGRL